MHILRKNKKNNKNSSIKISEKNNTKQKEIKIKKRKKIGFRPINKTKKENKNLETKKTDDETLEILPEEKNHTEVKEEKTQDTKKKKNKKIIKRDMKGKPVYLEDTGEKLGLVFDTIYDIEKNIVGYKIKDDKSDTVLSFPIEQFDEDKEGLIFLPGWYTNAIKIIERLEFKDKISPELTALISDDTVSNKELYEIFVKHDDEMADYIEDSIALKEVLFNRLNVLEKQRISMKNNLFELTEKRLIKDIDRREFSQDIMEHRRKANILDVNINKCKDLIKRLDKTSFGMLGKNKTVEKNDLTIDENIYGNIVNDLKEKKQTIFKNETQTSDTYKEKYFALKDQFNQLEEEYKELKNSVEKLFNEN